MAKWMFAALAALGLVLLGLSFAAALSRRAEALAAWGRALVKMEAGLILRAASLEELLEGVLEGEENRDVRRVLSSCALRMRCDPLQSFARAMEQEPTPELTRADRAALSPLWLALGTGDLGDQRALLSSIRQALGVQLASATEKEKKDRRLYVSLGVLGALVLFLFLM